VPKTLGKLQLEVMIEKPKHKLPRRLLNERHLGEFMRSFTFPMEVDSDGMKANLSNGLLRIVVPKKVGSVIESKRIDII
jgi:HSP20 family molecular chaperone IbpA